MWANGLTGENYWTFGQTFAMVNTFGVLSVLISRFAPSSVDFSLEGVVRDQTCVFTKYDRCGWGFVVMILCGFVFGVFISMIVKREMIWPPDLRIRAVVVLWVGVLAIVLLSLISYIRGMK